ncbi:hypothetical protein [Marilutibacter chinensis]|uniref:Uncharacterized protein n=1 Tax=Marilutibacter chinensis TaxID=2912247 RepID=A0ABS9HP15_9GAMM|nr:hypothetical protein [Lysobacter chinensis]MCF7220716.1 hypothetical protein [Lysobacter chinensis]
MKSTKSTQLQAQGPFRAGNVIKVSLPASAYYDLSTFQKVQKDILGRLGCLACCSGWDIRWDVQRNFLVDEKLNVLANDGPAAPGF